MNVFLSYASEQRPLAEELCHRLQAAGHEVFFDREDLPAGMSYDEHIRAAIDRADLFVFLVSPGAVADGRYTRTELKLASRRWPQPGPHVLPVLAEPTPMAAVPSYLRALNLLQPEGNLVAEVVFEVQDRAGARGTAPPPAPATAPPLAVPPRAPREPADTVAYREFRLCLRAANGGFVVEGDGVDAGPLGIDPAALGTRLWEGAVGVAGPARRGVAGGVAASAVLPALQRARAVGAALREALDTTRAGRALADALASADAQAGEGVRVVVDATDAPALAALPWELLYDPDSDDFWCADRFRPLVRRLDAGRPPPRLAVRPPLRLLVAVASPPDRPELQVGAELAHLDTALASLGEEGWLQTERLADATLERLDNALLRHRPHVLHLVGHGDVEAGEGRVILASESPDDGSAPVTGARLAMLLRNHLGHLRLVFLNSCLGAAVPAQAAFGGVAQALVRRGLPAAVAMQFALPDRDALQLARHFYRYLAAGQPVDAALASARAFLFARGDGVAWGAPVLYLNATDGRLFDWGGDAGAPAIAEATTAAAPAGTTVPADDAASAAARPAAPHALPSPSEAAAPRRPAAGRWVAVAAVVLLVVAGLGYFALGRRDADAPTAPSVEPVVGVASPAMPPLPAALQPLEDMPAGDSPQAAQARTERREAALQAWPSAAEAQALDGTQRVRLAELALAAAEQALRDGRDDQALALAEAIPGLGPVSALPPDAQSRLRRVERMAAGPLPRAAPGAPAGVPGFGRGSGRSSPSVRPAPGRAPVTVAVRPGDTLWGLAARFLGDGHDWRVLWRHHQAVASRGQVQAVPDPDRLVPGQLIALRPRQVDGAPGIAYHVQPGDSLSRIAQRVHGDASRWTAIAERNGIADPDRIRPGQVLTLRP